MEKRDLNFNAHLKDKHFRVAIFGSARVKRGDKTYKLVYQLAKMIGQENLDIVTGGGPGIMDAATDGHRKGNKKHDAHSFGLLVKLQEEQKANKHLDIKREFNHFSERLDNFMILSNAVVVAPGGIGTLLEFFYTWQLIQVKQICDIPIILVGDKYRELINWIRKGPLKHKFLNKEDFNSIFFARNPNEAMEILKKTNEIYKKGGKNICLNIKKYKLH